VRRGRNRFELSLSIDPLSVRARSHNIKAEEFDRLQKARSVQGLALTAPGVNAGEISTRHVRNILRRWRRLLPSGEHAVRAGSMAGDGLESLVEYSVNRLAIDSDRAGRFNTGSWDRTITLIAAVS
jgi:hypothetical protein